jgi:hypothetical protein
LKAKWLINKSDARCAATRGAQLRGTPAYILQMGDNHKRWPGMQTCLRLRQHISAHTLTMRDDRDHVESETAAGGPLGRASWRLLRLISACHMPLSLSSIRYSSLVVADSEISTQDPAYHIVLVCRKIGTRRVMNAAPD